MLCLQFEARVWVPESGGREVADGADRLQLRPATARGDAPGHREDIGNAAEVGLSVDTVLLGEEPGSSLGGSEVPDGVSKTGNRRYERSTSVIRNV